ncbi:hypothetical protein MLD38_034931 [Melastoma candidum]|uniref:Uncharacterized protein n=1 Tax=Melastoma candidum TaxID=119954 RepID=A0ACB9MBL3_9MYRT|nr:hypothetical protein MLD38_034931 [Melastoma candidum]
MAAPPPADVPSFTPSSGQVSDDYPLLSLSEAIRGYPATIDSDKNPLVCPLADLNECTWDTILPDQMGDPDEGSWRQKGVPRWVPLPDLPIIACWEISRAFHDRNGPETEWLMLQYDITRASGTFSICRIWKDPTNDNAREVGSPAPPGSFDNDGDGTNHYPFPGAIRNPFESDIFYRGDYMELLDLDTPLLPPAN